MNSSQGSVSTSTAGSSSFFKQTSLSQPQKRTRKELEEPTIPMITLNGVEQINQLRETNKEKKILHINSII